MKKNKKIKKKAFEAATGSRMHFLLFVEQKHAAYGSVYK